MAKGACAGEGRTSGQSRCKSEIKLQSTTRIVDGAGKKADITGRIAQIKAQIQEAFSDYDKEMLQERLSKLAAGVAMKEK